MSTISTDSLIRYFGSVAKEFDAKLNRVRNFVPEHNLSAGTANEMILRDFLAKLLPGRYAVGQGFVCDPTQSGRVSKQCDILVYNQADFPLVHSEGELKIVWPQSVHVVIEVKISLNKTRLQEAICNIRAAKEVWHLTKGVIFAFGSSCVATIIENLRRYPSHYPMKYAPEIILLLDQKTIFKSNTRLCGEGSSYIVSKAEDDGVLLAYLLTYLFQELYDEVKEQLFNVPSILQADKMTLIEDDVRIGI